MRKVIGGAFISLDGVVQAQGGPDEDKSGGFAYGGWLHPIFDEGLGHQVDTLFAGDFDLLLGRRTYEIFAAYWPFMPAGAIKLIEHRLTPGGMAMATYEPAGPLKTGSFGIMEPSEAERRRRKKSEAGDG